VETNADGHAYIYHFNDDGVVPSLVDPLGHTQSTAWTANDDLRTTTDGLNNSTTSSYDSLDKQIGTKLPTGATSTIGYTNTALLHAATSVTDQLTLG
jgi:uncharacterized protein RhaS with RHS repeats